MARKIREFVYPGSFDPFTKGHEDLANRASQMCDILHVIIMHNVNKDSIFSVQERVKMAELSLAKYDNIHVSYYEGLLVDYMKENNISVAVRGLRSESDFRYELQIAATNKIMLDDYDTILLPSSEGYSFTSSSTVREVASYGGDISGMVPEEIIDIVINKFSELKNSK